MVDEAQVNSAILDEIDHSFSQISPTAVESLSDQLAEGGAEHAHEEVDEYESQYRF